MESEHIVIEPPMSFTGSAKRLWNLSGNIVVRLFVLVPLTACVWLIVACWYLAFGVLLIPYRVMRRRQRRQKVSRVQHRELVMAHRSNNITGKVS